MSVTKGALHRALLGVPELEPEELSIAAEARKAAAYEAALRDIRENGGKQVTIRRLTASERKLEKWQSITNLIQ